MLEIMPNMMKEKMPCVIGENDAMKEMMPKMMNEMMPHCLENFVPMFSEKDKQQLLERLKSVIEKIENKTIEMEV